MWIRKVILWLMYDPAFDITIGNQARNFYFKLNTQYRSIMTFKMETTQERKLHDLTIATIMNLFQWDKGRLYSLLLDNTFLAAHVYTTEIVNFSRRNICYSGTSSYLPYLNILTRPIEVVAPISEEQEAKEHSANSTTIILAKVNSLIIDTDFNDQQLQTAFDTTTVQLFVKAGCIYMSNFIGTVKTTMIQSVPHL